MTGEEKIRDKNKDSAVEKKDYYLQQQPHNRMPRLCLNVGKTLVQK